MGKVNTSLFDRLIVDLKSQICFSKNKLLNNLFKTQQYYDKFPPYRGFYPQTNRKIIFAVCDQKYFHKFSNGFIQSIRNNSPDEHIHLHLYEPPKDVLSVMEGYIEKFGNQQLSFTWDNYPIASIPRTQRNLYILGARLIRVQQLLESSQQPILYLDIDSIIQKSLTSKLKAATDYDVGLFLRLDEPNDRKKIWGSIALFLPTTRGRQFCRDVAYSIAYILGSPPVFQKEVIAGDQLILFLFWKLYSQNYSDFRCLKINPEWAYWEFLDESHIWSAKGNRKLSAEFTEEALHLLIKENRRDM